MGAVAVRILTLIVAAAVPAGLVTGFLLAASDDNAVAFDVKSGYQPAAAMIRAGISPYPGLHYPPLYPTLLAPIANWNGLEWLMALVAIACVPVALALLGVRDWRVYGVAFLWAPVQSGIQTANLTLSLVVVAAASWRYRDRFVSAGLWTAAGIAAKVISGPFALWLCVTRRWRAGVLAVVGALATTYGLLILFDRFWEGSAGVGGNLGGGVTDVVTYADSVSYGVPDIVRWIGLGVTYQRMALVAAAVVPLVACVVAARRRDDRRAFALAAAATIVIAPNVWLHSLCFLLLVLGVLRPRLGPLWFAPVALFLVPVGTPTVVEAVLFWAMAIGITCCALAPPLRWRTLSLRAA